MRWRKLGLLVQPGAHDWMVTHAQNPFPERVGENLYSVHFAGRDAQNRARGGCARLDLAAVDGVLEIAPSPTLDLGSLGCFDDCGAMPSCNVDWQGRKYMYYTGWTQGRSVPFFLSIGLLVSDDGGRTYVRHSKAPVLGRNPHDPYLTASPWVMIDDGRWRMWYVSCTGWERGPGDADVRHSYRICHAESSDGVRWEPDGTVCIDYDRDEYAIARPVVVREAGRYQMWYCHRGGASTYRAGYAESCDGVRWERRDERAGIDVSPEGWDSEMICYPCVFDHGERRYMLYNGNGYGKTGFGLALLERD